MPTPSTIGKVDRELLPLDALRVATEPKETSTVGQGTYVEYPGRLSFAAAFFKGACYNLHSHWKIIAFGQVLSFLLACTGAAQATLALDCKLSAPTFSVGLYYFGLSFFLIPLLWQSQCKQQQNLDISHHSIEEDNSCFGEDGLSGTSFRTPPSLHNFLWIIPLKAPAWAYLLMAIMDVYANYFTVLAFRYTTITSVTLFDALAIPSAMILSRAFLSRKYTSVHLAGVSCCMLGIILNIMQDYSDDQVSSEHDQFPNKFKGDILALTGGLLYGVNNVLGEVAVRQFGGVHEYLGMLGFFATIVCVIQTTLLEREQVYKFLGQDDHSETCSHAFARWLLFAFVISGILSYYGASCFLQVSEATLFNLSLLTGDLWSVGFSVMAERIVPNRLFFIALAFIVLGVSVYETAPSPVQEDREDLSQEEAWREVETDAEVDQAGHNLELTAKSIRMSLM
jgi:solute carrier family 35 protein F1/2